jgi:RNA polymerase sigma factor (sigma-70 family)
MNPNLADLRDAQREFLDLVRDLRPELHRYCARMTGSVVDGEDVVQDTIVHAYYLISALTEPPVLRPWLFRIAHNRAIDLLRRYDRRMGEPYGREVASETIGPDDALDQELAARAALVVFSELPVTQRACVILKDVLGHSSKEIGEILGLAPSAVDACLHRGRRKLRSARSAPLPSPRGVSPAVERYATLFHARDWEGVRALLAEDVQLELVGHSRRAGREVGKYFQNYGTLPPYRVAAGWLEDREGLYVFAATADLLPAYFIEVVARGDIIAAIRDYRFVPYLLTP